jgi:hypothetical protein
MSTKSPEMTRRLPVFFTRIAARSKRSLPPTAALLPTDLLLQPVAEEDVARRLCESVFCSEGNHGMPLSPVRRRSRMGTIPSPQPARLLCKHAARTNILPRWFLTMPRYDF